MRCLNCLCGTRIEAPDADAISDVYWAHTDTAHADIKVPESRRQDVAAALRRSGGWNGVRETIAGPIDVRPLAPVMLNEYMAYFDGPAFADNPVWASCYCLSYHLDLPPGTFDERRAADNRRDRATQIAAGDASGVLAYAGDGNDRRVVGWCNASPWKLLRVLARVPEFASDDPDGTMAIVCFVIAPQFRGQGVAGRLLDGAVALARERGFRRLDAYPPANPRTAAGSYHGRLEMYLDAGFQRVRDAGRWTVVRKTL